MDKALTKTAAIDQAMLSRFMLVSIMAVTVYMMSIMLAYAQGPINTPMGYTICTIVNMVFGNMGRGLMTLAVMIVGTGATLGKVSWGMAITTAVGISIVANANIVVQYFGIGYNC